MTEFETDVLVSERRRTTRRRTGPDRKPLSGAAGSAAPHLEPRDEAREQAIAERRQIIDRRRQDRRRQIDPTTCERDYSDGEIEFMRAMDDYKRKSGRPFPTWSEVLEVLLSLGYRKVAEPSTLAWRTFGDQMGSL